MWLLVISHPDKAADSWWWGVWAGVGASRVEVCQDTGRFRVERISGPISGCCSTYLDPRGIPWRDQGGGALLHQIGEIGAAIEQFAGETVAGGWAPPPFPVFLEKEREGRATVQRGCLTGQVMEGGGTHAGVLVSVLFLNWGGWAHVLSGLCFYHAWPLTHTYTVVMCNSSVTSELCFQLQLTGPSAEAQVQLRFGPFPVRFPLTLCPFTIKAPKHILHKLFKSVCFVKLILNHIWGLRANCVNRPRSLLLYSVKKQQIWCRDDECRFLCSQGQRLKRRLTSRITMVLSWELFAYVSSLVSLCSPAVPKDSLVLWLAAGLKNRFLSSFKNFFKMFFF